MEIIETNNYYTTYAITQPIHEIVKPYIKGLAELATDDDLKQLPKQLRLACLYWRAYVQRHPEHRLTA